MHDCLTDLYDDQNFQDKYAVDYYSSRIIEIKTRLHENLDNRERGIIFESLVNTRFKQSFNLKQEINLLLQPSVYLSALKKIRYEVHLKNLYFIIFFLLISV